ncbi:MAG: DoxX family membrane protein [Devosia sp.]|nr:DoxX family protein [Devosiaceae bacterium]
MSDNTASRTLLVLLRLSMAWVFLYAASHQVFADWSVAGFLGSTKTFHSLFSPLTAPGIAAVLTVLVGYGHLAIGLSLLSGFLVRLSSIFGIALMLLYWMAHLDFPYVSNTTNLLLDEHIVYALILGLLIVQRAGHLYGLDGWVAKHEPLPHNRFVDWAFA